MVLEDTQIFLSVLVRVRIMGRRHLGCIWPLQTCIVVVGNEIERKNERCLSAVRGMSSQVHTNKTCVNLPWWVVGVVQITSSEFNYSPPDHDTTHFGDTISTIIDNELPQDTIPHNSQLICVPDLILPSDMCRGWWQWMTCHKMSIRLILQRSGRVWRVVWLMLMSVHGSNTWRIFLYVICAHSTNLQSSDGGRSRVMMVEDGGCLSCVVWMVPDRSRDVWIDHRSSMANARAGL